MRIFRQRFSFSNIYMTVTPVYNSTGGLVFCYTSLRTIIFLRIFFKFYVLSNDASRPTFNAISRE
jgi:hypothetical protein